MYIVHIMLHKTETGLSLKKKKMNNTHYPLNIYILNKHSRRVCRKFMNC